MIVTVNTSELLKAAKLTQGAASKKDSNLILAGLYIVAGHGTMRITGYDLNTFAQADISASTDTGDDTEVDYVVDASSLVKALSALPKKGNATLEYVPNEDKKNEGTLHIKAGSASVELPTMPACNFPAPLLYTKSDIELHCTFKAGPLVETLKRILPARGPEKSVQPYLQGVNFKQKGGNIELCTTDTFRLALETITPDNKATYGDCGKVYIMPAGPLDLLLKAHKAKALTDDAKLSLIFTKTHIFIDAEGLRFVGRLLEGQFPQYERLINGLAPCLTIAGQAEDFAGALKDMKGVLLDKLGGVEFALSEAEVKLSVVNRSGATVGATIKTAVPAQVKGEAADGNAFVLRHTYVHDYMQAMGEADTVIGYTSKRQPVLFTSAAVPSYKCIIMPIT